MGTKAAVTEARKGRMGKMMMTAMKTVLLSSRTRYLSWCLVDARRRLSVRMAPGGESGPGIRFFR